MRIKSGMPGAASFEARGSESECREIGNSESEVRNMRNGESEVRNTGDNENAVMRDRWS